MMKLDLIFFKKKKNIENQVHTSCSKNLYQEFVFDFHDSTKKNDT